MTKTRKKPSRPIPKTTLKRRPTVRRQRPLHKRFFLHPITLLFLLCVGVLLIGSTIQGYTASSTISAVIEAPELNNPAVFSEPTNGSTTTTAPIMVSGSCPDNSYVNLYRNGQFSGTDICSNNVFQIQTDLFLGANKLTIQDYNTTNEAGPVSTPITVTYAPSSSPLGSSSTSATSGTAPVLSASGTSSEVTAPGTVVPPLLDSAFQYLVTQTGKDFSWSLTLSGGTPPYKLTVDWGDNNLSTLMFNSDPTFTIHHIYHTPGTYTVQVNAVDFAGSTALLQLQAIIHGKAVGPPKTAGLFTSSVSGLSGPLDAIRHALWIAWPSYAVVVGFVFSFWLGEHEELRLVGRRRTAHR